MDNFDKLYRKYFQGEKSELPIEQEDQLWDSIVDDLGPENSIPIKGIVSYKFSIAIFSIIAISVAAFYIGKYSAQNDLNSISPSTKEISKVQNLEKSIKSTTAFDQKLEKDTESTKANKNESVSIDSNNKNVNSTKVSDIKNTEDRSPDKNNVQKSETVSKSYSNTQTSVTKTQDSPIIKEISQSFEQQSKSKSNIDLKQNIDSPIQNNQTSNNSSSSQITKEQDVNGAGVKDYISEFPINKNTPRSSQASEVNSGIISNPVATTFEESFERSILREVQEQNFNEALISSLLYSLPLSSFKTSSNKVPVLKKISERQKSITWTIDPFIGLNYTHLTILKANTPISPDVNQYQRSYFGYQAGVNTSMTYRKHWIIESGIQYESTKSIFDKGTNKNISKNSNLLTGILFDYQSRNLIQEYNTDTTTTISSFNRTLHINTKEAFIVPLAIGYKYNYKAWILGLNAGIHGHFLISAAGRTIDVDENSIRDYTSSYFPNISLGYQFSPTIQYRLSSRLRINISYNYMRRNFSNSADFSIREESHQLNTGISYRF